MIDVPSGWLRTHLRDVLELKYGKPLPERVRQAGAVSVYGSNGVVGTHVESLTRGPTIVVGRKGSVGEVHVSQGGCWPIDTTYFVDDFTVTTFDFTAYLLKDLRLTELDRSSAVPGLSREEAYALQVPVPPIGEQRRIVEKLDAIFEKSRAAKARLERLPALLDKLKRSILAAAFRGDLTKEWRAKNPNVEPASVLLERIRAERRRKWEEGLRAKGKDPKKALNEEPDPVFEASRPALPASWTWASLDDLVEGGRKVAYGVLKPGEHAVGGVRFIKSGQVRDGYLDLTEDFRISPQLDEEFWRTRLKGGEILLNLVGASIGRSAIAPDALKGANVTRAIGVIPIVAEWTRWVHFVLVGPSARQLIDEATGGSAQGVLNLEEVRRLAIPLPPAGEREAVIEVVAAALAKVETLVSHDQLDRILRLEQAALAKAFRGGLVPQDPTDEQASVVLDHIRARADEPKRARRGRFAGPADPALFAPRAVGSAPLTNDHKASEGKPADLVVRAFESAQRLTSTAIADATGLDGASMKRALKALVEAGQVRVEGKARGTAYVWVGQQPRSANG